MIDGRLWLWCVHILLVTAFCVPSLKVLAMQKNLEPDRLLVKAVLAGDLEATNEALRLGASPNATYEYRWLDIDVPNVKAIPVLGLALGWKPVFAQSGCMDSLVRLARYGVDANIPVIRTLLNAGADITRQTNFDPVTFAIWHCNAHVVRILLDHYRAESPLPPTNLIDAAQALRPETVKELINRVVDMNACDREGITALIAVAMQAPRVGSDLTKSVDVAQILINHGANPDIHDKHGMTALMWAVALRNKPLVTLLVQKGATINLRDNGTQVVISLGNAVFVRGSDEGGRTALDWARNAPEITRLLKNFCKTPPGS